MMWRNPWDNAISKVPSNGYTYTIYRDGNYVLAKNNDTGEIEFRGIFGTDDGWVFESVLEAIKYGGSVFVRQIRPSTRPSALIPYTIDRQLVFENDSEYNAIHYFMVSDGALLQFDGDSTTTMLYANPTTASDNPVKSNYLTLGGLHFKAFDGYNAALIDLSNINRIYAYDLNISGGDNTGSNAVGINIGNRGGNGHLLEHIAVGSFNTGIKIYDDHTVLNQVQVTYFTTYGISIGSVADVSVINPHIMGAGTVGIQANATYGGQVFVVNPYFERSSLGTYQWDVGLNATNGMTMYLVNPQVPNNATTPLKVSVSDNANLYVIASNFNHKYGTATFSGDGSTTSFTISYDTSNFVIKDTAGNAVAPKYVRVIPMSADASAPHYVTWDTNGITITFQNAPPSGTDNIKFYYEYEW